MSVEGENSCEGFYPPVKAAVQGCVGEVRLLSVFPTFLGYRARSLCLIHLHPDSCFFSSHPLVRQALQLACKALASGRKEQQKKMHSKAEWKSRSEANVVASVTNASAKCFGIVCLQTAVHCSFLLITLR